MIPQVKAELVKIRSTRTTVGLIVGMVALHRVLHAAFRAAQPASTLASKEDQRELLSVSSLTGVFSANAVVLLGDQRVPLRHDPSEDPVQPRPLTYAGRQGRRRRAGRTRIRGPRRGDRLGNRLHDPRRPWHHRRAHQRRHSAAHARRARRRGPVGPIGAGLGAIIHNQVGGSRPRSSLGASSSTTSCSGSSLRWGGSCQPVPRTHSWACESNTWSRQASARSR